MAKGQLKTKTVPQPVQQAGTVRPTLKAGAKAVAHLQLVRDRAREIEQAERESRRANTRNVEAHLAHVEVQAKARGEEVERVAAGPLHIARDGLAWMLRKGQIQRVHADAGLKFRADYETANGAGVKSCLAGGVGGGGDASPTDEMIKARSAVNDALRAMPSPMLRPYIEQVAGEGRTLSDPMFGGEKRSGDHILPCLIALDVLARHYGMIR